MLLEGTARAVSFAEKLVVVTDSNKTDYFADDDDYSGGSDGVKLLYDGSGGGEVTMHLQLNVPPEHTTLGVQEISDIAFPDGGGNLNTNITLTINCPRVTFTDAGALNARFSDITR